MLLPNPPDNLVNELQKTAFQFVWNRKQDRISRKIAVRSIAKGGLGIPNIKTYINALKLIWIRKLKTSEHKWKSIIKSTYPKVVWFEQLGSSLHFQEHEVNKFWSHVFMAYKEFGKQIHVENSEELVAEPVFCNQNILVGNRIIFSKNWIDKGVCHIKNMLNDNGTFMSFKSFKEKFGIKTDYITYTGCVQAIKSYIRKTEITVEGKNSADLIKTLKTIYNQRKGSRLYYEVLTQNITRPNCCDKWEAKLNKDINWCITFKKMQQIQEIKLKWFQIRLVHRIIATNVVLMHMGIENDITCSFCRQDRDSINHIFWSCTHVRSFWEQFQIVLNAGCSNATSVTLNENIVLFGHDIHFKSDSTFDLIILQAKFFIYKCKINKTIPQLHSFKRYLKTNFEVYKYNAKLNMSYDKIVIEWCPYQPLIDV